MGGESGVGRRRLTVGPHLGTDSGCRRTVSPSDGCVRGQSAASLTPLQCRVRRNAGEPSASCRRPLLLLPEVEEGGCSSQACAHGRAKDDLPAWNPVWMATVLAATATCCSHVAAPQPKPAAMHIVQRIKTSVGALPDGHCGAQSQQQAKNTGERRQTPRRASSAQTNRS